VRCRGRPRGGRGDRGRPDRHPHFTGVPAGRNQRRGPPDVRTQYRHLVGELATLKLAYLHVHHLGDDELLGSFRDTWPAAILVRYGREREQIADDIDAGLADIAPLGRLALANPDIVQRLRTGAPLNELDPGILYGGGAAGYTDYPALAHA
jgi:2,4-dienoyl-CoA reductase-like NADH-dependent reductase (Old Yellow Enzyme family)